MNYSSSGKRRLRAAHGLMAMCLAWSCAETEDPQGGLPEGATGSGGQGQINVGGANPVGGTRNTAGVGGKASRGGGTATGGAKATGGGTATGGNKATGGTATGGAR